MGRCHVTAVVLALWKYAPIAPGSCPYQMLWTINGNIVLWMRSTDNCNLRKTVSRCAQCRHNCVCGTDYVNFVIWTKEDIHIESESGPDLRSEICQKSIQMFQKAITIASIQVFSQPPVSISAPTTNPGYCYCGPLREVDDMIVCEINNALLSQITWSTSA